MPEQPDDIELLNPGGGSTRQPCTAPGPEVTDLVGELGKLSRLIVEHNVRVMAGEWHDWDALAQALAEACRACRERAPIELHDIGDAGAR